MNSRETLFLALTIVLVALVTVSLRPTGKEWTTVSFSGPVSIKIDMHRLESRLNNVSVEGKYYTESRAEVVLADGKYSTTIRSNEGSQLIASGSYCFDCLELKLTDDLTGDWMIFAATPLGFSVVEVSPEKSGPFMFSHLARNEGDPAKMGRAVMRLTEVIQIWEQEEPIIEQDR